MTSTEDDKRTLPDMLTNASNLGRSTTLYELTIELDILKKRATLEYEDAFTYQSRSYWQGRLDLIATLEEWAEKQ